MRQWTASTRSGTTRYVGTTRTAFVKLVTPTHTWKKDCVRKCLAKDLGVAGTNGPVRCSLSKRYVVQSYSQTVLAKRRNAVSLLDHPPARIGGLASSSLRMVFTCFIALLWHGSGLSPGIATPPEYSLSPACEFDYRGRNMEKFLDVSLDTLEGFDYIERVILLKRVNGWTFNPEVATYVMQNTVAPRFGNL